MPATETEVHVGCLHHSFYEVAARVVGATLEDAGHSLTLLRGPHAELYPKLAGGVIDLLVASWLPHLHAPFYEPVKQNLTPVVSLFEDARAFWAVPDYVPGSAVGAVADLLKPDVAARMVSPIVVAEGAIAVRQRATEVFEAYDLGAAGYLVQSIAADDDWSAQIRAWFEAGDWFVAPLWQPHFLNRVIELRQIDEPKGLMGAADTAWLMANAAFLERLPPSTLAALKGMEVGLSAVTDMDVMVNVEGHTPAEAARRWLAARD